MANRSASPRRRHGWPCRWSATCGWSRRRRPDGRRPLARLDGLQQLAGLAEVLDFLVGLLMVRLELAAVAVDPDDGNLPLDARLDVGLVAGRDVHPVLLLLLDPARALLEVGLVGLVGAHLLRRHDQVEIHPEVAPRRAEQFVVDVRQDPDLVLLGEALELGIRLTEGRPARDAVGEELRAGRLELPVE